MTAHRLAKILLKMEDLPVIINGWGSDEGLGPFEVQSTEAGDEPEEIVTRQHPPSIEKLRAITLSYWMKIRIGVEGGRRAILDRCRSLSAPILISANSLWNQQKKAFGSFAAYTGFDCALDSGGFVAMKRYGGYRWSVAQ